MLLGVTLVSVGCGGAEQLSATDPDTRFELNPGEEISIVLEANPTTGFGWALEEPPPSEVIRLVDDRYEEPVGDVVGAPGHEVLTFEAVDDGSTYLQLWYVRPFDDPPVPEGRVQFEVIVGSGEPPGAGPGDDTDTPQPAIPDDEEAITVAELLDQRPEGEVVVTGSLFDGGSGLVVCEALAESFPPQCPGQSVAITNPDRIDAGLVAAGDVRWAEQPVTLLGVLTEAGFEVRLSS